MKNINKCWKNTFLLNNKNKINNKNIFHTRLSASASLSGVLVPSLVDPPGFPIFELRLNVCLNVCLVSKGLPQYFSGINFK
jgi:hypothetical protein